MIIGFDASRAFVKDRTGTENYSYQLLKALALIDTKNDYLIYLRPGQQSAVSRQSSASVKDVISSESERRYKVASTLGVKSQELKTSQYNPDDKINPSYGWPDNFHFKTINFHRLWTQVGLALQTFKDPLDILFIPSHTLPLIRKPGLKTIITVHDLGSEYLPFSHQLKQLLYLKFMTYIQLKTANKIIAVSEATKKDLVGKVGLASSKIDVVYEGCALSSRAKRGDLVSDLKRLPRNNVARNDDNDAKNNILKYYDISRASSSVLRNFGLEKDNYFLFVGTIQPRKNLERLIEAYSLFLIEYRRDNPPDLVIAGSKGWKENNILELSEKLGIENKVKFIGRVKDQDLPVLYKKAIAFVYTSLFEGFGLPILEAFASGTPVITSNISSMPEIAGKAAILVNPYKVQEITEAMLKITSDNVLRDKLMHLGHKRLEQFSWTKCAEETLEVFKSVVS